jgi:glycosyltransferase involved in cell wall biosynthesis
MVFGYSMQTGGFTLNNSQENSNDAVIDGALVSVGIPTYDRPEGSRRTLGFITGQTYKNLEIIVSDNCSPGLNTEQIVREFMTNDHRIQFYRQDVNRGMTYNFQFVLDKSNGEYFMWASDDDEWDRTFIAKCVGVLEKNPEVVLCATYASLLDSDRKQIRTYFEDVDSLGLPKLTRIKKVILGIRQNTTFHGLRRTKVTKKLGMSDRFGFDHVYMMILSFHGSFVILPEILFKCHVGGIGSSPDKLVNCLGSDSALIKLSPSLYIMKIYFQEIKKSDLSSKEKIISGFYVVRRYLSPRFAYDIFKDFAYLPLKVLGLAPVYRK